MNFTQFVSILRARWLIALGVFLVTVVTTVVLSLVLPKQYSATASVVVDVKPDPVAGFAYPQLMVPAYMATQVDVIESDRVALRVVRNLKLAENPQVRKQWQEAKEGQGSIEGWLIDTFKKQMDVKPSRESNVISVAYRSPDPRFAAALANAFVKAYLDTTLELRVDPARQYSNFFDVRTKEARDTLEKAQAKLSAFQRAKGIIATDERLDVENARLNELNTQLVTLQAISAESTSRQAQASGGSADHIQEVLTNPVIGALKADLAHSEAKLKELSARLGDNNPQVIEAKANVAEMRERIAAETKKVTAGVGVSNTINRQREAQIKADLEAQRAKVLQMKAVRDEGEVLVRDVENAQRAYEAVQQRYNQTSLESQTTQSNVNVLTEATPPEEPSSPKLVLNTILSIVIGLILAIGAALGIELLDRRVRGLEDVGGSVGLPVLGVLPKPNAKRGFGRPALPMVPYRLLPGLPGGTQKGN